MSSAQTVVWHEPKAGSTEEEWEDAAGYDLGRASSGRIVRCIVVDGATEAYDSIRWVSQLVDSFLGLEPAGGSPALTREAMDEWFGLMQQRWLDNAPSTFGNIFEERKFQQQGSFATLLGCWISGLDGPKPSWSAVALGDTVLFHVREQQLLRQFPEMTTADFGVNPEGVFTQPQARERMRDGMSFADGVLVPGDRIFIATDALAAWLVKAAVQGEQQLWQMLARLDHPVVFRRIVDERRRTGEMKNDDVTLMRIEITGSQPQLLVVCR